MKSKKFMKATTVSMILAMLVSVFYMPLGNAFASSQVDNIVIDGYSSDWSEVSPLLTGSTSVKSLSASSDDRNIYMLVKGYNLDTKAQFYINSDNNSSTGYTPSKWSKSGADFRLENSNLYMYTGSDNSWSWKLLGEVNCSKRSKVIEAAIPLSDLSLETGDTVRIGFIKNGSGTERIPRAYAALPAVTLATSGVTAPVDDTAATGTTEPATTAPAAPTTTEPAPTAPAAPTTTEPATTAPVAPTKTEPAATANEIVSGAFYVSSSGSDTNSGSVSSPWKTIQKAANSVKPGDTVYVRGGTYNEKVNMKVSGTADAYITFKNYPGETPVIDGTGLGTSSDDAFNSMVYIGDKSYIKLIGFNISNFISTSTNVPAGIRIEGASKNIELRNNKVSGIKAIYSGTSERNAFGIVAYGTNASSAIDRLVIDNCEVTGCQLGQSESVSLNGNVTNFQVTNNKVHDNDNIGIVFIGYEGTASSNDYARNGICSGNQVWNISSGNNATYAGDKCADGLYVDGGAYITMENNKVWNCDIGIEATCETQNKNTSYVTIRNNLVYDCSGFAGISIGGAGSSNGGSDHILIYNNTVYNNASNMVFNYNCQVATNVVKNNIFFKFRDSNIEGTKTNIVMTNNITTDPGFVVAGSDFHINTGSVAINAGVNDAAIGSTDLDGNSRLLGTAVDIGCYEKQ